MSVFWPFSNALYPGTTFSGVVSLNYSGLRNAADTFRPMGQRALLEAECNKFLIGQGHWKHSEKLVSRAG